MIWDKIPDQNAVMCLMYISILRTKSFFKEGGSVVIQDVILVQDTISPQLV